MQARLGQFFRDAAGAMRRSPEVRQALKATEQRLEAEVQRGLERGLSRWLDRFEVAKPKPGLTAEQKAANAEYVTGLYRELLGREPDPEGLLAHLKGLEGGTTREQLRDIFLGSDEYRAKQHQPVPVPVEPSPSPAPAPAPAPRTYPEPGPALSTVPPRPEYLDIPVDRSSASAAALSVARWVRANKPEFFDKGDDRSVAYEMMSWVIGALRAHGYDAHRVVNHPSRPMGDGYRYGSDAVVLEGTIYDVFGAWGDPGRGDPMAMNVGPYAAGRLRE
ncbi:MAG: hypothetical protein AMXMBFR34_04370 [Myxococcaceae bacterium]